MSKNTRNNSLNLKKDYNYSWVIISLLVTLVIAIYVVRIFLYDIFSIPAASMSPTINVGNFVIISKGPYGNAYIPLEDSDKPKRGEIFAFYPPYNENTIFLKRIIGIPNDTISFSDKRLTINSNLVETNQENDLIFSENLNNHHYLVQYQNEESPFRNFKVTVPEGHYFVMGDNRDNSADSRAWGFVPIENMVGKLVKIW